MKNNSGYRKSAKVSSERSFSSQSSRSGKSKTIKKASKPAPKSLGGCKQKLEPRKSQFVRNIKKQEQISDEEDSDDISQQEHS
mgnify:FL=1